VRWVVPFTNGTRPFDVEGGHLGVGDDNPARVSASVDFHSAREAGFRVLVAEHQLDIHPKLTMAARASSG